MLLKKKHYLCVNEEDNLHINRSVSSGRNTSDSQRLEGEGYPDGSPSRCNSLCGKP